MPNCIKASCVNSGVWSASALASRKKFNEPGLQINRQFFFRRRSPVKFHVSECVPHSIGQGAATNPGSIRGVRQHRELFRDRAECEGRQERQAANDHDRPYQQCHELSSMGRQRPGRDRHTPLRCHCPRDA